MANLTDIDRKRHKRFGLKRGVTIRWSEYPKQIPLCLIDKLYSCILSLDRTLCMYVLIYLMQRNWSGSLVV